MRMRTVLHAGLFVALVAAAAAGISYQVLIRVSAHDVREVADQDARVMGWVVERNPQATIKDFYGFTRGLLAESAAAGVDYRLVMAIIDKESQFNPRAVGAAGEIGLMQVMPSTAGEVAAARGWTYDGPTDGRRGHPASRYATLGTLGDPAMNVRIGLAYLKDQVVRFGTTPTALRAYNRGPTRATVAWRHDRYAEDVALRLIFLVHKLPER